MIPRLTLITWFLVLTLLVLGAYLRHSHSGSGCSDWPECYGRIDTRPSSGPESAARAPITPRPEWAIRSHRGIASLIAVLVIGLVVLSLAQRRRGGFLAVPLLALGNVGVLVVLGLWGGDSRAPINTVGNLLGGVSLLCLLGWHYLSTRPFPTASAGATPVVRPWIAVGLLVVGAEIVLGAVTSANYAALACTGFPHCNGNWWPSASVAEAFDLSRTLATDESGTVIRNPAQAAAHLSHRLGAVLVLGWGIGLLWHLGKTGDRPRGWDAALLVLIVLQITAGITVAMMPSMLTAALGHSIAASLLLVALLGALHHHASIRVHRHHHPVEE